MLLRSLKLIFIIAFFVLQKDLFVASAKEEVPEWADDLGFYKETFPSAHKKGVPVKDTARVVSEAWNCLSDEQKEPYVERFNQSKEVYKREYEVWKEEMDKNEEGTEQILKVNKKVARKRMLKNQNIEMEE